MLTLFLNTTYQGTRIYLRGSSQPSGGGWIDPAGGGDFFYGSFSSLGETPSGYKLDLVGIWTQDSLTGLPAEATVLTNRAKQVVGLSVRVRNASGDYVPVDLSVPQPAGV